MSWTLTSLTSTARSEVRAQSRLRLAAMRPASECFTAGYTPTPPQRQFHDSTATNLMYGGAAGGGKSRSMREDALDFCAKHPGVTVLFLRRTFPELRDTHWLKLVVETKGIPVERRPKLLRSDWTARFPNGSTIIFGHCQAEDDAARYLGAEYDRIYFDELTTFTEWQYDRICSRLRTTRKDHTPQVKSSTNPGSVGHAWVKQRWIDRDADYAADRDFDLAEYEFIPAKLSDNPHINEATYTKQLKALPPDLRKAYLDGDWNAYSGAFFTTFRRSVHVRPDADMPSLALLQVGRGMDYGATAPLATYWGGIDRRCGRTADTARIWIYREHYEGGQTLPWHCQQIIAASGHERYDVSVADPSMWGSSQFDLTSLALQADRAGLALTPADNDRRSGWAVVKNLLEVREDGLPGLIIAESCTNLIRTLPSQIYAKGTDWDLDTKGEDHAADALRYLCKALLALPEKVTKLGWSR